MGKIHEAIDNTDLEQLQAILNADPGQVEAEDEINNHPLHGCASAGNKEAAELLIQFGADVNSRGDMGRTPLHYAVDGVEEEVARILLQAGADINVIDGYGQTALLCAVAGTVELETIAEMLIQHGATIDANSMVWIFSAAELRERLDSDPNLMSKAPDPGRLVNDAVIRGDQEIVEILIENGAPIDGDNECWPLFSALSCEPAILRTLLEHGADPNVCNSEGQTILKTAKLSAKEYGLSSEYIDLLEKFGAKES